MKRLTLEEIGKIAGVSRATVSRVINNHPNISDEVRQRVQQVIDETGYQPNIAARTLASDQSRILGLVIPSILSEVFADPYYPRLMQGIAQACNEANYTLTLFLFHTLEEEQEALARIVRNALLDGLIVTADFTETHFVDRLLKSNMPFVQIGMPASDDSIHYVDADNRDGGRLATQHLIDLGRKRIGQISSALNTAGDERYRGYEDALADNDIEFDSALIAYADFTEEKAYTAMHDILPHKPDAMFIQSDKMARGAIKAITAAGLSVPEDIAIVGFDDLPPATNNHPHLTTVRQPIRELGIAATKTLIDVLKNPHDVPQHTTLPVELIIRESCGAIEKSKPNN